MENVYSLPVDKAPITPLQNETANLAMNQLANGLIKTSFAIPLSKYEVYSSDPEKNAAKLQEIRSELEKLFGNRTDELTQAWRETLQKEKKG